MYVKLPSKYILPLCDALDEVIATLEKHRGSTTPLGEYLEQLEAAKAFLDAAEYYIEEE